MSFRSYRQSTLSVESAPTGAGHPAARVLFVPVSAPRGMGEYARSLAIARALVDSQAGMEIRFALSRMAPYATDTPFPATLLPSSPTFHTREVGALIREFRPHVVIFDNAGRTAQLRAAREQGTRIVFVSSRPRQRRRAFRLSWMRLIDEHWIAWPRFMAGELSPLERLKLRMLDRPNVRFIDVVMPAPDAALSAAVLARFGIRAGEFVLAVPGGGSGHPGAENAPTVIGETAHRLAAGGQPTVLVGIAPDACRSPRSGALRVAPRLSPPELAELMRTAKMVISNGGDTLLQALACHRPCVAIPIAEDQAHRIRRCVEAGLVLDARLDVADLERVAVELLGNRHRQAALAQRAAQQRVTNGIETALAALGALALQR